MTAYCRVGLHLDTDITVDSGILEESTAVYIDISDETNTLGLVGDAGDIVDVLETALRHALERASAVAVAEIEREAGA